MYVLVKVIMIGIFDSGFGGLTVFKHIVRALPAHDFLYLGDSARTPYGNRSQEVIYQFTTEAVDWLFRQGCGLVILACNSASAEALRRLQQEWLPNYNTSSPYRRGQGEVLSEVRRVLGVIRPVVEEAVRLTKGRVGVLGTRATVTSGAYERELKHLRPDVTVVQKACPLLVPLIEEGWARKPETRSILRSYIHGVKQKSVDTLILGCTHYPILLRDIKAKMGRRVTVLDPGPIVAEKLVDYLKRHPEIDAGLFKGGVVRFATTDDPSRFNELGGRFFGQPLKAEKVILSS